MLLGLAEVDALEFVPCRRILQCDAAELLDDIWAFCDPFLKVCDDIEGLLTENRIFKQRNVSIAVVKLADAWGWGFSGVMVHGSGAAWDSAQGAALRESGTKRRCQFRTGIPAWLDRVINTPERNS